MKTCAVEGLPVGASNELLLRRNEKLDYNWSRRIKALPWNGGRLDFPGLMSFHFSSNVIGAYFWRTEKEMTAEPISEKMTLPFGKKAEMTVKVVPVAK